MTNPTQADEALRWFKNQANDVHEKCAVIDEYINDLHTQLADWEEVNGDKKSLCRMIDEILWGKEGMAKQASLCDLVGPIRDLKVENTMLRTQLAERDAQLAAALDAAKGVVRIVDEIDGGMRHGIWRDKNGRRFKDTEEYVTLYLATRQLTQAEDMFKKHGIKYFDRDPMHDPWGWDGCKWYYSTPEQALEAKLEEDGIQPTQDKGE